ncbi:MAG: low-specificity L-threonine aldolase [Gemmatimonadota bacterium]|nr:MAG: low-specificity L-threonine aldolase [Gemmatimonadota bacterium]
MEHVIDLRSDTVTKPSPEMRRAMAEAVVGDDVFGEDPTVNRLQERVAALLGKEAALFVPSGSMANLVAISAHTERGDEVIIEKNGHTFNYESGSVCAAAGIQLHPQQGERGVLDAAQIEAAIRPPDHHFPPTRLIVLENTHNRGGGTVYPIEKIGEIRELALSRGIQMHLDGARLWNACVASGRRPSEYARYFDSLMMCFSKGLGAPIGSVVVGSKDYIEVAHRYRKLYGGGMRQVGVIAAAAQYALDHNVDRLAEDHDHAKMLAQALAGCPGVALNPDLVETNIIIFDVSSSGRSGPDIVQDFREQGVLMLATGPASIRAVTHLDVSKENIEKAIEVVQQSFRK